MTMVGVVHQMPATAGRVAARRGDASPQAISDETPSPRYVPKDAGRYGSKIHRELMILGVKPKVALMVAENSRRWWRNSGLALNNVLTLAHFDRLGMPRLT